MKNPQSPQANTQTHNFVVPHQAWNAFNKSMISDQWTLPMGYIKVQAGDINAGCIIKVEDNSKKTNAIHVNTCEVSPADRNTNDFPEYIKITSNTNKIWYYKYAGDINGYPFYITPKTDTNNNVYVLCKQNGEYKLMQFDDFSGYRMEDTQNKQTSK